MNYRQKVLSSLKWQASAQFFGQIASWLSTIVVIRLLDPTDYGVMALATIFVSFVLMMSDLGIGAAIVQAEKIDKEDWNYIQGFVFLFNVVACLITLAASSVFASFFGEPRLVSILIVLSSGFLLIALYVLPQSRLIRELEFGKKAKVDIAGMTLSAVTALACAMAGCGVWSLVAGTLVRHGAQTIGFNVVSRGFVRPRLSFVYGSRFLQFGTLIVVDRLLWFVYSNLDLTIAGKLLGQETLGFYSVALMLAAIPLDKVMPVLTQVAFPAVARIQNDPARVRAGLLRVLRYANTFFLPIFWGMALVASDGLLLLLSEKWQASLVPFQLICVILPLKAMAALYPPALFGVGRPLVNVVNMAVSLVLLSIGFTFGVRYGVWGLAMSWVIVYPFVFLIISSRAFSTLGMAWFDVLGRLYPAFLAAIVMSSVVYAFQVATPDWPVGLRLICSITCGCAVYTGIIALIDRAVIGELRSLLSR